MIPDSPFGFQVGAVTVWYYALVVVLAVMLGTALTIRQARRDGEDPHLVLDIVFWGGLLALVLGRIFYAWNPPPSAAVVFRRDWYFSHPFDLQAGLLAVWQGGLGMAGALTGGLLGSLLVILRQRVDGWAWADRLTLGLLLGLMVGCWANLVTGQLYGPSTGLLWGITPAGGGSPSHPTPAYLSIWILFVLIAMLAIERRSGRPGIAGLRFLHVMPVYLIGLLLADTLRVDVNRGLLGLTGVQALALALLAACAVGWLVRRRAPAGAVDNSPDPSLPD
ncbi:MAG: prolipoprotein diacylglyceryl transferase [Anaerolineae bacterium]|nr:prolipoprotein diacylglyceryl transferase [Anaerolineae bacterium]